MVYGLILQVTQTGTQVTDTLNHISTVPPQQASMSLWELLIKGGPIMIPLLILSVATVYLVVERLIVMSKASDADHVNFMNNIRDFISNGKIEAAVAFCKNHETPVAKMIGKGLKRVGKPLEDIEKDVENVGKMEIYKLEKNISLLGTIAGIAPMFGFLGTIFGVIKIFYNISLADNISIGLIAGGLYEKMITSASGLLIGIIAYLCHHFLVMKLDRMVNRMEQSALEFIDILQEPTK